ncbi:MAG: alanine racemase [Clostridia bacterium]|nr:alanine racemase [Clostridia bacterium]
MHFKIMRKSRIYAEINLDAICENARRIKEKTGNRRLMAIIKADGYGHGALPIAQVLSREGLADAFGIATVDEAAVLRRWGVQEQILVLGYTFPEQYGTLLENDITQTIFDYKSAKLLSDAALRNGKTACVHIKLDTGMGRIGFLPCDESIRDIVAITKLEGLNVEGIFSHFACADMKDDRAVYEQKRKFDAFIEKLEQNGVRIPIKHICNSAGIIEYDSCFYDMTRSGIILYGLYPSDDVDKAKLPLIPAMKIRSHVSYVKTIEKGDCVSYGSTFVAAGKTVVATVPIGYGDGYPRTMLNTQRVLINGKSAPVIGRICMDQFMVDVTDIPGVKQGDGVTVLGKDGGDEITVDEIARNAGIINYEFVCGLSRRVPRIYIFRSKTERVVEYLQY